MVSFWWVVLALLIGTYLGAILVGLMTINTRDRDRPSELEHEEEDAHLLA